jgi:hypothetical protein
VKGYNLSKALYDHNNPRKMAEFLADLEGMSARYRLSREETDAIRSADLVRLHELGANPYLIRFAFRDKYER